MSDRCGNFCPPEWTGPWRDWHRGHGCNRDPENVTTVRGFLGVYDIAFPADGGEPTITERGSAQGGE